ncbi:efflux RND transporter periplasmic adaptor subunit [Marilutibacter maris]|nr:HlyD family efflux transporter periplasmic adaptor subunit [Lysobacter maris]
MDKQIEKKRLLLGLSRNRMLAASGVVAALLVLGVSVGNRAGGQEQKLSARTLTTATVREGRFDETLSVRGTLGSRMTIYLDTIAGGFVEEKFVQPGVFVEKGQPLVRLANTNLQLDVISREAQIAEQINFQRNNQLLAENSRLQLRTDILDNENRAAHIRDKIARLKPLVEQALVASREMTELEEDLRYYTERNRIARERQRQEEAIRARQEVQMRDSIAVLEKNLAESRRVLDQLTVKAPEAGFLSQFDVELGESKTPGTRLGQIDVPGSYRVVAALDEYYLNRVSIGLPAILTINGKRVEASVSKIDGRVEAGKFQVDVDLPEEFGSDGEIKVGQGIDIDFVLGAGSDKALMIPRGAFLTDTGGNWIFVLDKDGDGAERRSIKLGERNKDDVQVVSGLEAGEVVIVSSYSAFDKADNLILN